MRRILPAVGFAIVTFILGFFLGVRHIPEQAKVVDLTNKDNQIAQIVDFAPFWKTWNVLNEKYVPTRGATSTPVEKNLYTQKLVWGAISGMVSSVGDPYTVFFPPTENELFKSDISGNFEGVGMEISLKDDVLTVVAPLKGSPAEKAGVKSGDKVLEIDGKTTQGMSVDEAVTEIRGAQGTKVNLTILRGTSTEPIKIAVTRDVIDIPTLKTETKIVSGSKIFIIHLYSFTATSPTLFRDALQEFVNAKTDKLVLDLRGNPGGYLEAAVDMASWFLPEGKVVVREYFGPDKNEEVHRSRGYNIFNNNLKMVVLIDGGSASASEILAGALREDLAVPLVGAKSFGKGSVQELVDITDKTALKVTIARWLTPNGNSISEKGIEPDYKIDITKDDVIKGRDPQLDKAIQILNK